jgi:dinuclear metal center YbgI/SA1388 family protein
MQTTTIRELVDYLSTVAPPHLQESYDNAGLLTGDLDEPITGVMTALDMIEPVLDEAIAKGCNVVVAHHPIIFRGLKRLTGAHYVERVVIKAIRAGIALYAIHTNLDSVLDNGVNQRIGQQLGLTGIKILQSKPGMEQYAEIGMGAIGRLPTPMDWSDFVAYLKKQMDCAVVRHTAPPLRKVHTIAVCGGSGGFVLEEAVKQQADVLVTADFKYHEFFEADGRICIADIGHYESEQFTIQLLKELIDKKFRNFAAHSTTKNTNPIKYA